MKSKILVAIAILATLPAAVQAQLQGDIKATVTITEAETITRTTIVEEMSIGDLVLTSNQVERVSKPVQSAAAIIDIVAKAPKLRVKCRTAEFVQDGQRKVTPDGRYAWTIAVAEPGQHLVELLAYGIIDGELFLDELDVEVAIEGDTDQDQDDDQDDGQVEPGPLQVLIIHETATLPALPPGQQRIFTSRKLLDYLAEHCSKTNGIPDRRFADVDVPVADGVPGPWADWLAEFRSMRSDQQILPWIIIDNGRDRFAGALPANVESTLDLLKRYGGN